MRGRRRFIAGILKHENKLFCSGPYAFRHFKVKPQMPVRWNFNPLFYGSHDGNYRPKISGGARGPTFFPMYGTARTTLATAGAVKAD